MGSDVPEIWVDFNARMTERGYMLTRGTYDDLDKLGLKVEQAVGMSFLFNGGADTDEHGNPADIMSGGIIVVDREYGFLAETNRDFFWRRTA